MHVVDSSVVVAALVHADADLRSVCRRWIDDSPTAIAHVLAESYARMTGMPGRHRLVPVVAGQVLTDMFPDAPLTLSAGGHVRIIDVMAGLGVPGGAVFDCLIAETAREHGATLVSLDRRAAKNYAAVGVQFVLI